MRTRRCVLALVLAVAACGGDDDGDGGEGAAGDAAAAEAADAADPEPAGDDGQGEDSELDGCDLLTQADAEAMLGDPVERKPDDGMGGDAVAAECTWAAETETGFKQVFLTVFNGAGFYTPDLYREEEGFEELDGLGDAAFIWPMKQTLAIKLDVLAGDRTVSLGTSGWRVDDPDFTEAAARAGLLDLAPKVLDRL